MDLVRHWKANQIHGYDSHYSLEGKPIHGYDSHNSLEGEPNPWL
jgi:hypothetical protein